MYLKELKKHEIQFAFRSEEMARLTSGFAADNVLCFDFNIPAGKDAQLQKMENYLHGRQVDQELQLQSSWHKSQELRQQLQRFVSFVTRNRQDSACRYVVTNGYYSERSKLGVISIFVDACPTKFEPPDEPGVPYASSKTHTRLQLSWGKPKYGSTSVQSYKVSYRSVDDPPDQWSTQTSSEECLVLTELTPGSLYHFKVKAESIAGSGPESKISDPIEARPKPWGASLLSDCKKISQTNPSIYQLPLHYTMNRKDIAKVVVGKHLHDLSTGLPHKVLMVVGGTGAGKTTLINGMANYIMGVDWEDDYRFQLISEDSTDQTKRLTECITAYTFHKDEDSPLPYTLTVIDTPGFLDTAWLERDKQIVKQIKEFFSIQSDEGIDQLHGIGLVTQHTFLCLQMNRIQRCMYDSILSVFGKDLADNIFLMLTFADKMFWEMSKMNFENFFAHFARVREGPLIPDGS